MNTYHPLQINDYVHYRESLPCKALRDKVVCFWELRALKKEVDYFVIPDACVDIVINCGKEKEVYLSPTLIKPDVFQLAKKEIWFGIRLLPAMASQLFSIHLAELKHQAIELSDVQPKWSRFLEEKLFEAVGFEEKIKAVEPFLIQSDSLINGQTDTRLQGFIQTIYHTHGNISIAEANKYFISSRHLRRLFHQHIGVSPKKFARIVRSQYFLKTLKTKGQIDSLYDGYFDQAHFIKEIKEMTSFTPKQIIQKFK
ncbi:MAG: DUF6597 domain-containing transcriptional factor [Chitinophagales bacterium]